MTCDGPCAKDLRPDEVTFGTSVDVPYAGVRWFVFCAACAPRLGV